MNKIIYPIANTLTLIITLFVNYWTNTGQYNGKTVADISARYNTLFTPAGYAFAIWGFIYLFLIVFVGYQWYSWSTGKGYDVSRAGWWLVISNLLNASWVLIWLQDQILLSVGIMLLLLLSLIRLVLRLQIGIWEAPNGVIAFVWWPVMWYFGWIVIATVANISAFLVSVKWHLWFADSVWTLIMIGVSTLLYFFLLKSRNLRESALVGVWGLTAIAVRQWNMRPEIAYSALLAALLLLLSIGVHAYRRWNNSLKI